MTESGAESTAETLVRFPYILELREAFGLRRVHRRFFWGERQKRENLSLPFVPAMSVNGCRSAVSLHHFNRDFQITVA